ncbi:hypothetical protein [Geomonas sp.]|uniref:hypothetical protein n=1 Tax=Geomonas sp. TaxID=2651584 RepID=UPI002B49344E|nr:hypothetical protein [Geomonas sp.]HJV36622.1 hypothetical protein [Geomonas sp.]
MRKSLIPHGGKHVEEGWLDLEELAQVEITSEDHTHPIESALRSDGGLGWRAAGPGPQIIRLLFDQPLRIRQIHLVMEENEHPRTQEFVLRWSGNRGKSYRECVRQQFNFSPPGTIKEEEDYTVDLAEVTALELEIKPDIGGGNARASLVRLRLA